MTMMNEIMIRMERPDVAVIMADGSEALGFFHKWTEMKLPVSGTQDMALVEMVDGTMHYFYANCIRFLPVKHGIPHDELETLYREHGLLKGK
jgi:hypothetical protein